MRTDLAFIMAALMPLLALGQGQPHAPSGKAITLKHPGDHLLDSHRWRDHAYGVSLRYPLGDTLTPMTDSTNAALRMSRGDRHITLSIIRSDEETTLGQVKRVAYDKIGGASPSEHRAAPDQVMKIAGRDAAAHFLVIVPPRPKPPYVLAQAFLLIDAKTIVMLELECDPEAFAAAKLVFDQVMYSIELGDLQQLDAERAAQFKAGIDWLASLKKSDMLAALHDQDRWFRVLRDGKDMGTVRIRDRAGKEMGIDGVGVELVVHVVKQNKVINEIWSQFVSQDGQEEIWSVVRESFSVDQRGKPVISQKSPIFRWRETGTRDQMRVDVRRRGPGIKQDLEWRTPDPKQMGFLSLAHRHLIGALLRDHEPVEMAFYGYNPADQRITLHTFRLTRDGAGYRVFMRPTPERAEHVLHYSTKGDLRKVELPSGQTWLKTSPERLKRIWASPRR